MNKWIEIEDRFVNLKNIVWIEKYSDGDELGLKIKSEERSFKLQCMSNKQREEKYQSLIEQIKECK